MNILIWGAAGGIGKAHTQKFAAENYITFGVFDR